jgi:long-chain fatty acid transport protein
MARTNSARKLVALVAAAFMFASSAAEAGGFAVREQSASGLGAAFAGVAAGYDLSSIFWNPAGVSVARGIEAEADGALILPDTHIAGTASLEPVAPLQAGLGLGPSVPLSLDSNGGGIADPAFIPAMYAGMQLNDRLSVGFGFNGPFGLVTEPDNDNWAGKFEARTSKLRTYDFNPVASYRVTPNLVVGAGAQIEFAKAELKSAFPVIGSPLTLISDLEGPSPNIVTKGDDFGFGYTLGILWSPLGGTDIGLGFRSSVEHTLDGQIFVAGMGALGGARTSVDLETPEIATASVRQKISERVTLLGTLEWTSWSDLNQVIIEARTSNPNLGAVAGSPVAVLPLNWHDGWFFSGGAEFEVNDRTLIRAGVAYEESPIQNATERTARDPDTNRIWLSFGATYNWSAMTTVNLGYSHVFFDDGAINRTSEIPGVGQIRLLAEAEQDVDIVAVSVRVKLGHAPTAAPLK